MADERHITVRRTARYYTLGPADGSPRQVWFVLHGYGQLASQFVRVFEPLDDGTRLIVAPEALNKFYLVAVDTMPAADRPVGATWMTREDREKEIEDYIAYLDDLAATVLEPLKGRGATPRLVVLAFSQGTATAARWITRGTIRPSDVILWGGLLPPEIDFSADTTPLRQSSLHFVLGSRDQFVSDNRVTEEERRLREAKLPYRLVRYTGGHGIARDSLLALARTLDGA
jgi:predicted esterase